MGEERREILKMISEGIITPEEGERLLDALGEDKERPGFEAREEESFEDVMEQFGEEIGRRVEKWAESFGRDMENLFESPESPFRQGFGREQFHRRKEEGFEPWENRHEESSGWVPTEELPGWDYDPSIAGRRLAFSGGKADFSFVRGLIIQSPRGGCADLSLRPSEDGYCRIDEDALGSAVQKGEWAVLNLAGDGEIFVPKGVEKIGLVLGLGDVKAVDIEAELWIKLFRGDIHIEGLAGTAWAATLQGNLDISLASRFSGTASLNTLQGNVTCRIPLGTDLEFTGRSIKGEQSVDGPGLEVKGRYRKPGNIFLTGLAGAGGSSRLTMETTKGDIRVSGFEERNDENA